MLYTCINSGGKFANTAKDWYNLRMNSKRLYKSETDQQLSGVCGGLAEYFSLDPTLVRMGYVLLTVFTGFVPGIIGYVAMAAIVPKKSEVN